MVKKGNEILRDLKVIYFPIQGVIIKNIFSTDSKQSTSIQKQNFSVFDINK